jgi:hypothetical protein
MNLSFVLDVALGLIFIYLILSLLASEIQELVATVFQWRAEHLRKSIEILLGGDVQNSEDARIIELANRIYNNPLIKNINQEAKGVLALIPRRLTWAIASFYRSIKKPRAGQLKTETVFGNGKRSGPSYIPATTFATTLLETMCMPLLVHKLTETRLDKFKNQRLSEIQNVVFKLQEQVESNENFASFFNIIYQKFAELQADFEQIAWNYQQANTNLIDSMNKMAYSLDRYIDTFNVDMPKNELSNQALLRLQFLRKDMFDDVGKTVTLGGLQPNIKEVVQLVHKGSNVYQELAAAIGDKDSETHKSLERISDMLPDSVAQNLTVLADRAYIRAKNTQEGITALQQEISTNFDMTMERASGVYKRNAKGVALLIGFTLAISANADALHIINRLSKDSALRETITNNAGQILIQNNSTALNLETLRNQTEQVLKEVSLPIGWSSSNLQQQIAWTPQQQQIFPIFKFLSMILGWLISGIAIAMGAPFWFDLLGKIVNVRNTGRPPASSYIKERE